MLKDFLAECLEKAKEEYFKTDHHGPYTDEEKDVQWSNLLKHLDRDFYEEWIDPIIWEDDLDLWNVADKFMMYMVVKEMIDERNNG